MRLGLVMHNVVRGDGQGRVGYEIARYALRQGHQVSLLADRVDSDLVAAGATWIPLHPRLQRPILLKAYDCARLADRMLAALETQFDIIHGFGYTLTRPHTVSSAQFVHRAWLRSPMHIARGRRDLWGLYQRVYTTMNARWETQAYPQAKRIVACSGRVREELIAGGVPAERICVIHNAVDIDEFAPGPIDRKDLGLPADVPLALFVGDIRTERKNLGTVLHALVSAPGAHLAVVGALPNSPFPGLARQLGLADRVHFLGYRRDVGRIMRAVDLYVFPSRYEPFGIVVLEALASGTPVITTDTVGAAEVVTPDCGLVLPDPNDAAALGKALTSLLCDPSRRARMGVAGRAIAEQNTWTHMAEKYLQLYMELAGSGGIP